LKVDRIPKEMGVQDLDRHPTLEKSVPRPIDLAGVAAGDRLLEYIVADRVPWSEHVPW